MWWPPWPSLSQHIELIDGRFGMLREHHLTFMKGVGEGGEFEEKKTA